MRRTGALARYRICDFTGQLAGAGATRWLAAFGADVIRIEDPVRQGSWDILRSMPPYVDERRGVDFGGGFNNHNVEKRGIALNLRTAKGKELLAEIVKRSDVVSENFAAGVMERLGFGYERLRELRPDVIYVSNCGFGHTGPYRSFKTWGPIVQALCGLTWSSGLPDQPPAGWGYSYMDHTGGYAMAIAILLALVHRERTGEGQWVDLSCAAAGLTLTGPAILDYSVNGRPSRRPGQPNSNRSDWPPMAPHGIYRALGEDDWIAIACRDERDWRAFAAVVDEPWTADPRFAELAGRLAHQDELDRAVSAWTRERERFATAAALQAEGVPATAVQRPNERIDEDPNTRAWGLWPTVTHSKMGRVRVDGMPVHFSKTDWKIERGAPCVGEHTDEVLRGLLGLPDAELARLREEGVT
ncbi:MAG: CoA transferase [Myxococcales bacterium]|nr:MAG: CoA transferase [Myxococcales bacterium]